jgi:hypothetical protein
LVPASAIGQRRWPNQPALLSATFDPQDRSADDDLLLLAAEVDQ